MYKIRIVDADDDETAETLGDLHRLTFFDGALVPQFDSGRGGSPTTMMMQSPSLASYRPRMRGIAGISAGSESCSGTGGGDFN